MSRPRIKPNEIRQAQAFTRERADTTNEGDTMKTRLRIELVVEHDGMVGTEELHRAVETAIAGESVHLTHDEAIIDEVGLIETIETAAR